MSNIMSLKVKYFILHTLFYLFPLNEPLGPTGLLKVHDPLVPAGDQTVHVGPDVFTHVTRVSVSAVKHVVEGEAVEGTVYVRQTHGGTVVEGHPHHYLLVHLRRLQRLKAAVTVVNEPH